MWDVVLIVVLIVLAGTLAVVFFREWRRKGIGLYLVPLGFSILSLIMFLGSLGPNNSTAEGISNLILAVVFRAAIRWRAERWPNEQ